MSLHGGAHSVIIMNPSEVTAGIASTSPSCPRAATANRRASWRCGPGRKSCTNCGRIRGPDLGHAAADQPAEPRWRNPARSSSRRIDPPRRTRNRSRILGGNRADPVAVAATVLVIVQQHKLWHFYVAEAAAGAGGRCRPGILASMLFPQGRLPGDDGHHRVVPQRPVAGYKTGEGIDPALCAQFPCSRRRGALGVTVWPMVEFEADDAWPRRRRAAADPRRTRADLHAGQGPGAVRPGSAGRAARSARARRATSRE